MVGEVPIMLRPSPNGLLGEKADWEGSFKKKLKVPEEQNTTTGGRKRGASLE